MLEETRKDLFDGALPVSEPEAPGRWDVVELIVAQLRDTGERSAGVAELFDQRTEVGVVGRVGRFVLARVAAGPVSPVRWAVPEAPEKSRWAMCTGLRRLMRRCPPRHRW
jgi:hypothetical protein